MPEKAQAQHNYVLFPRGSSLPLPPNKAAATTTASTTAAATEPLVFTVPSAGAPKPDSISGPAASRASGVSDTYSALFDWALATSLTSAGNIFASIVRADPRVFHSAVRQPFRPSEKAVHVKAFRGSKDGFLYFLPTGILWAFKKPLLFISIDRVAAVSYTNVLQRTFNIVVDVEDYPDEIEFAMLDQEDFGGIDESYVRRHGLQDRSMAEQRKAKRQLAENAKKGPAAADGEEAADDDGKTELEKAHAEAEQQLQDDEDDEEEDYDPGSEGDSEGEGSSDDDGEEDGGGDADEDAEEAEDEEDE